MICVQELERDSRHDQQDGWTRPNVRICKTVLDFGLDAVDSWFCIPKFSVFRHPDSLKWSDWTHKDILKPKVNGNKRDKREITIDDLNFPGHCNDQCDIIKCSLRQLSIASFLRSNCCSAPDIYYLLTPPPPPAPPRQKSQSKKWIDGQNIFKFTNETQSIASRVLDKILEKKTVFFRYFWPNPRKPDVLNIYTHAIR